MRQHLLRLNTLPPMPKTLTTLGHLGPDRFRLKIDEQKLWNDSIDVALESGVFIRDEVTIKLVRHDSIRALKGEEAAVNELAFSDPFKDFGTGGNPANLRLFKQSAPEAVDANVLIYGVGVNLLILLHLS